MCLHMHVYQHTQILPSVGTMCDLFIIYPRLRFCRATCQFSIQPSWIREYLIEYKYKKLMHDLVLL